ncbi:NosD domain-containing protein [Microbulbifer sp. A4B17]|uniref:NosD domain-containing protein n=1 Tax=Microbulbifer sp. A4B17 TaxID=359370 RepID=UPI001300A605|nr:NosD domain-containing protein [Microbulbifer sp. A4B17]
MNGYTLSCDGDGIGVRLTDSDTVLEDTAGGGSIENCNNGVSAEGGGGHSIYDINATANFIAGIALWSSGNSVETSYANGNWGMGIRLMGDGNRVRNSEAMGNSLQGVKIVGNDSLIQLNDTSSNGASGIAIDGGDGGIIADNLSDNNGTHGIKMLGLGQVGYLIIGNTAMGSGGADMADDSFPARNGNVWIRNDFDTANNACIQ